MNLILLAGLVVASVFALPVKHHHKPHHDDEGYVRPEHDVDSYVKPPKPHHGEDDGKLKIKNLLNSFTDPTGLDRIESKLKKLKNKSADRLKSRSQRKSSKISSQTPIFGRSNKKEEDPIPRIENLVDPDMAPYLFEGDIFLQEDQIDELLGEMEDGEPSSKREKRQASTKYKKWTNNKVYYYFDDNANYVSADKDHMRNGFKFWSDNTCVTFTESKTAANRIKVSDQFGGGCWADLGMVGGEQRMSLGSKCQTIGTVAHEMAHSLGIWHQQSRWDRESYVEVHLENVNQSAWDNYDVHDATTTNNYDIPYEYGSVMHYGDDSFALPGAGPAMEAKNSLHQATMGQRHAPEFNDILLMNKHYNCLGACASSSLACKNGGYPNPANCAKCVCPGGYSGTLCDTRPSPTNSALCAGSTLTASTSWKTFNGNLSLPTSSAVTSSLPVESCTHWITAPPKAKIELQIVNMEKRYNCDATSLEVKGAEVMTQSGYRICPADYGGVTSLSNVPVITTLKNQAILILRNAKGKFQFQVKYRYINPTCQNLYNNCDDYANTCSSDPTMAIDCPVTCNNGACATACKDEWPEDCPGWAANGDCEWDLPYMEDYCKKSCKFC